MTTSSIPCCSCCSCCCSCFLLQFLLRFLLLFLLRFLLGRSLFSPFCAASFSAHAARAALWLIRPLGLLKNKGAEALG
jgi:hypothetical protein